MDSMFPSEGRLTSAIESLPVGHCRRIAAILEEQAKAEPADSRRAAFWGALLRRMSDAGPDRGGPGSYLLARSRLSLHEDHAVAVLAGQLAAKCRAASQHELARFWDAVEASIEEEFEDKATTVLMAEPFFRKITSRQREQALRDAWERAKARAGDDVDAAAASCERFMEAHERMVAELSSH